MKEFKGTPGPWEIMMDDDEIKIIQSESLEDGACYRSYVAICEYVQCKEDASLIEASPNMLAALQLIIECFDDHSGKIWTTSSKRRALDEAHAAIKKALGE